MVSHAPRHPRPGRRLPDPALRLRSVDSTPNDVPSPNRYPAYLVMQNLETYGGKTRLTLRPRQNLTLVGRYEYQLSTIHTKPDGISGLGEVESAEMRSHIL